MNESLIIVPCGKAKIWSKVNTSSSFPAKNAYIGTPFVVNRKYAEAKGKRWVILSAKYGYIDPDTMIRDYDETFKDPTPSTITVETLKKQIADKQLERYTHVIGLGGKEYRAMIQKSFAGTSCRLEFPFADFSLFDYVHAVKSATTGSKNDDSIIII